MAQDWYTGLTLREDWEATWANFRNRFTESWGIAGFALSAFTHHKVAKQLPRESPDMYFGRVITYMNNALPLNNFNQVTDKHRQEYRDKFPEMTNADYRLHREITVNENNRIAKGLHTFFVKYYWMNGLISPYKEILKSVDPTKKVEAMVDAVQREAYRRLDGNRFKNTSEAMKAYAALAGKYAGNNQTTSNNKKSNAVAEVLDDDAEGDSEEVAAATGNGNGNGGNGRSRKKCTFCKRTGHVVRECRTKANKDKNRQQNNGSNGSNSNANSNSNAATSLPTKQAQPHINALLNPVHEVSATSVDQLTALQAQVADLTARLAAAEAKNAITSPQDF